VFDARSTKIRWDEETIAKHDEERGTRQKVRAFSLPRRALSFSHNTHWCDDDVMTMI
jgi:hypothetical protein